MLVTDGVPQPHLSHLTWDTPFFTTARWLSTVLRLVSSLAAFPPHFLLMSANSASGSTCHRQPSVYLFPLIFCISLLQRTFLRCALRQRFSNAKTSYQQLSAVKKQAYQVIQEGEVGGSCAFHSAVLLFKHLQGVYSLEGECLKLLPLSYSSIQRLGQGSVWTEDREGRGAAVSSSRQLAGGKFHSRKELIKQGRMEILERGITIALGAHRWPKSPPDRAEGRTDDRKRSAGNSKPCQSGKQFPLHPAAWLGWEPQNFT